MKVDVAITASFIASPVPLASSIAANSSKNEGPSCEVVENTWGNCGILPQTRDIDENEAVIRKPVMSQKTRDLAEKGRLPAVV